MPDNRIKGGDNAGAAGESGHPLPAISLPKGGGAIRGMGEKFSANPVTGTGSLSVPIFTAPGRSGFSPQLSIAYDSGAGNGPFGFGWQLSVPKVTRKTDKGLPRYQDDEDSDVFILSDAEDLVPALTKADTRDTFQRASEDGVIYTVTRYRPRVEGLFARIERWRNDESGETHWRSTSRENVTTIYGASSGGRVSDPKDSSRVFTWLAERSYDGKGNVLVYEYKAEDRDGVVASLSEQNHLAGANRYLKRIKYGNVLPHHPEDGDPLPKDWHFQVVFDYGEHYLAIPRADEDTAWPARPDAFSSYRAGFEIRTYRLCRRVLMFHQFAELGATPCLVRSTDFEYKTGPIASYLTSVTQRGYIRNALNGGYEIIDPGAGEVLSPKSLPSLEFSYSEIELDDSVHFVDAASLENLPAGFDGARHRWVDLDGEGLPGILTEQADAWFYKRNLSSLPRDDDGVTARFGAVELVARKPSLADLQGGRQQLIDIAGDGQLCLVQFNRPLSGYYERDPDGQWQPFTPFSLSPVIEWNDPNLKYVDIDGDGHPDILIAGDEVFTWYASRARDGFGPAQTVRKSFDEDKGPALVFADGTQSIYLADLSGDGLTDLVRIRNGEVCYWPNLGYGRFGAKIMMGNAPLFDTPDRFDQKRILLADIDGSGTTDIIYLGDDQVTLWFNQSGNSWSAPRQLSRFPAVDDLSSVTVVDLLGNGTACLVWSSPLPGDALRPLRYIDLMAGQKPHLLVSVKNNLGAETKMQYAASTKFYLQDRMSGTPWVTRLPFPVHVVERVETYDRISQNRFVTRYAYHHGYYDGVEREFRGFGMVEQWDTAEFAALAAGGAFPPGTNIDQSSHVPPAHTKTWFHNGAYIAQDNISQHFVGEYYRGDPGAGLLPDTVLPGGLTAQEQREACRALKGRILRQEVYADDNSARSQHPYSATEHTYHLRLIQPVRDNPHAVFYAYECEALAYHYEREPADPRVIHQMTLEVDEFGNVTKAAAVAYARRPPAIGQPPHPPEQTRTLITYTENDVTNKPLEADWYRIGVPSETRTYELTGFAPADGKTFALADFIDPNQAQLELLCDSELAYEETATGGRQKRLIERTRTLYLKDDLSGPLPPGEVESLALPFESYRQAFTPGLLKLYQGKIANADLIALLEDEARYRDLDAGGAYWIPSGRVFFSPVPPNPALPITQDGEFARQHFYLIQAAQDPFGNISRVSYDPYDLLVARTEDALGNAISAQHDYRVVQPALVTDANENRAAARFDALGMVVATAVMGKAGESDPEKTGDTLDDPTTRLEYSLFEWADHELPNFVHTFAREQHGAANPRWQESYSYSDGFGREIQRKIQAEPGDVGGVPADPRWVGSGWTVFNNKGKPIKNYEPFFSATHEFEFKKEGVSSTLFYDPLERAVATLHPNHTYEKVVFDSWRQETWDVNDTVSVADPKTDPHVGDFFRRLADSDYLPTWFESRQNGQQGKAEQDAAAQTAAHADTPAAAHSDTLGRTFLTVSDNGAGGKYETRVELDIEGNQRSVTDALGRTVMSYDYDMLTGVIHQLSMDAGERWTLRDVAGKPVRAWDSRQHTVRTVYDELHRPTHLFVRRDTEPEALAERTVYGEPQPDAVALNLRGKVFQHFDGAGTLTSEDYDFKGNLLGGTRQLLQDYQDQVDWSQSPALESETFKSSTTYDALNRPVTLTTPDKSVIRPTYNEANLLERVDVNLRGAAAATVFVANIDYNAKGQRTLIEYGNGVKTEYAYDSETFRLVNLKTTRPAAFAPDQRIAQDLSYTYDPAGNITSIRDDAQPTIFFNGQMVEPSSTYIYDAIYRLIGADGREHIGQLAGPQVDFDDSPRMNQPLPTDAQAMRNYCEAYEYDAVGNILKVIHRASKNGDWTRRYAYDPAGNRLLSTSLPGDPDTGPFSAKYTYDAHGNMTAMPHLAQMEWDFKDQLHSTQQQAVNGGSGEKSFYVYDSAGQRVRKVTERPGGTKKQERIYLGAFELYREYDAGGSVALERETLHVMDGQRRIAQVDTKTIDASAPPNVLPSTLMRYQFDNHLGSASLELDDSGAVISYEEYYPYGSTSYQVMGGGVEVGPKRYRYTGKERDEETGLYYHGARYYSPWLARWISCDPIQVAPALSRYTYVYNNPIILVDPNGLDATGAHTTLEEQLLVGETLAVLERHPDWSYEAAENEAKRHLKPSEGPKLDVITPEEERRSQLLQKKMEIDKEYGRKSQEEPLYGVLNIYNPDRPLEQFIAQDALASNASSFAQSVAGVGEGKAYFESAGKPVDPHTPAAEVRIKERDEARPENLEAGPKNAESEKDADPGKGTDTKPDVYTDQLFRWKVKGPKHGSGSRGYNRRNQGPQKTLDRALRHWGRPGPKPDKKDLDLGHRGTPHSRLAPGVETTLEAQPRSENRSAGSTHEKDMVRTLRDRSKALGLDPHNPSNPYYTRPDNRGQVRRR